MTDGDEFLQLKRGFCKRLHGNGVIRIARWKGGDISPRKRNGRALRHRQASKVAALNVHFLAECFGKG
jgi:hypothetical protein